VLGIYLGMGASIAWNTVRAKPSRMTITPGAHHLKFESIRFQSKDGTPLSGWWIPAEEPKGVVILCHGVDSTKIAMLFPAKLLHEHGFSAFVFDFRARGESGGNRCTLGFCEVEDLHAAVDYAKSRADSRNLPVGVFGESMGAAVAIMGTARDSRIRCVAAESPFAQLDHAIRNHFLKMSAAAVVFDPPSRWIGEILIGCRCPSVAPVDEIGKIAPRPILLVQDKDDQLCPPEETRLLMEAAGQPKELWTVPNSGHIGASTVEPAEFARRIPAFFEASLK